MFSVTRSPTTEGKKHKSKWRQKPTTTSTRLKRNCLSFKIDNGDKPERACKCKQGDESAVYTGCKVAGVLTTARHRQQENVDIKGCGTRRLISHKVPVRIIKSIGRFSSGKWTGNGEVPKGSRTQPRCCMLARTSAETAAIDSV